MNIDLSKLTKEELIAQMNLLMTNAQLGCYTRQAFETLIWPRVAKEAAYIIFFDVDDMKGLNNAGGWDNTSAIIKRSIVVRSTDYFAAQVLSGDEFVVVITDNPDRKYSDPEELCKRLLENFRQNGASATFAFRKVTSQNLEENLKPIKDLVKAAKDSNRRGTITLCEM